MPGDPCSRPMDGSRVVLRWTIGARSVSLQRALRPRTDEDKEKLTMTYHSRPAHLPGAEKVLGNPLNHWR
jgi:hypothetical protein